MAKHLSRLSLLLFAIVLVGCDHATKLVAQRELRSPLVLVRGVFDLGYAENRDTAFSLLRRFGVGPSHNAGLLAVSLGIVALVAVLYFQRRHSASRLEHLGFTAVLAGAAGNVIDRLFRGYVIDFLHVAHWPVFNVADSAIVVGLALLVIAGFQKKPRIPIDPGPTSRSGL